MMTKKVSVRFTAIPNPLKKHYHVRQSWMVVDRWFADDDMPISFHEFEDAANKAIAQYEKKREE